MPRANIVFAAGALLAVFAASAEIYKWVDEGGRTHYGDRPGSVSEAQQLEVDAAPSTGGAAADSMSREEKRRRLLESMQEDRLETEQRRAEKQAERERSRQRCNQYRDRMRQYGRASRLYKLDRNGNRIYMSEADRKSSTRELQAMIRKYCK